MDVIAQIRTRQRSINQWLSKLCSLDENYHGHLDTTSSFHKIANEFKYLSRSHIEIRSTDLVVKKTMANRSLSAERVGTLVWKQLLTSESSGAPISCMAINAICKATLTIKQELSCYWKHLCVSVGQSQRLH